jgi:ribonuclease G
LRAPRVAVGDGHMMVEPTRALVAVDVNTGADTSPAAALKINIAAARDLPRQLRLRGLGGQVVVDFAPMPKRERAILDQVIRAAFKAEGEVNLAGWTTLGLYELTRKRDRLPLTQVLA